MDTVIEAMRQPEAMPPRIHMLWLLGMLRRARRLMRVYLAAAEITEPAERVVDGQRWLDELDRGPP